MKNFVCLAIVHLALTSVALLPDAHCLTLPGSETSYARFPPWVGCPRGFFSFDFKTRQSDGLLWYMDDRGAYDFFEVMLRAGKVRLVMNIVDGREGHVELVHDGRYDDDRWHRVEVRRRKMETLLTVDGLPVSGFSFGTDVEFGSGNSSYVFVGGIPVEFSQRLKELALPSVTFQPRFKGQVRNVFYSSCECETVRVEVIDGVGMTGIDDENCLQRRGGGGEGGSEEGGRGFCRQGCLCVSTDVAEPECDCSQLHCSAGETMHNNTT